MIKSKDYCEIQDASIMHLVLWAINAHVNFDKILIQVYFTLATLHSNKIRH